MELTIERDQLKLHALLEGTTSLANDSLAILMHGFKGDLGYDEHQLLPTVAKGAQPVRVADPTV